jgi:phage repressor protein C with HTH and peptisase S24 domain
MGPFESIDFVATWTRDERERLGWKQAELAERATDRLSEAGSARKLSQQTIDQLERRQHKGVPDWFGYVRQVIEDEKALRSNAAKRLPPNPAPAQEPDLPQVAPDDIEMIPEVDIRYGMGPGQVVSDFPEVGHVPFNRQFRRTLTDAPVDRLFIARGDGDSMMPTLINGDMVLIDTTQNRIVQGDRIFAVSVGDAGMIKRVRVLSRDQYELHSDNQLIRPQVVDKEELAVVGRVVWIGRRV